VVISVQPDQQLMVNLPNTGQGGGPTLAPGQRAWVSWAPSDMLLLLD
jgi:hypothetical protein